MQHTKSYLKGHPNPQFTRHDFVNLDGDWDFTFDDKNEGIKKKYFNKFPKNLKINVPVSYEYPASNVNDQTVHNVVWYHKEFNYTKDNKLLLLHFEGVDYEAKIYVNGKFVGTHQGAYSRFTFDITEYVKKGTNNLVVRVYDDLDATHSRGKQRWMNHNYECFYVQTTGIWKTVWLEKVSSTHLKDVVITPSYANSNVFMEFYFAGNLDNTEIETIISFKDLIVSKSRITINRPIINNTFDLVTDSATMKLKCWSHHAPDLYDVEFNIYQNNKLIDTVRSYFGISEFLARGNTILLNRSVLFPKLILDQGYLKDKGLTFFEEDIIKDINLMKEIGLNGCRKHQKIECDLFYYYCDILGYYLWQELPSAYEWRNNTIHSLTNEWLEIVKQHHNHPCIMTEVIVNESWGTMAILNNKSQQEFATGLYYLTKSLEPNRFVISNDGWEHTISDLINVHNYSVSKDELMNDFDNLEERLFKSKRNIFTGAKTVMCDNYEYSLKPALLTEFAGIAFSKDRNLGWGYGDLVNGEEEFLARFKEEIDAIHDGHFFAGYCITQLSDVQQEVNGLVDEDRNFKVDKNKLKQIIDRRY